MGVDGVDTRFIHSELSLVHRLIFSSVRSMNMADNMEARSSGLDI